MKKEDYFSQVTELLRMEADAITCAAGRLRRDAVERAVELLASCTGKVVTVGIGKSGHVAQKLAATLTSTGTAAVFLHPSDALHGGIGMIKAEDVVVVLSNSGETYELLELLPHLKQKAGALIAVVGNLQSTLAQRADVALDASVDREACPLNLAPTTSTTVALAIGDALAMTLMRAKQFRAEDFALNHPAGRLGKRLTLKVSDLMHTHECGPTVRRDATLLEVVRAIGDGGLGAVNVVDDEGRLVGIITDGDVRRTLQKGRLADLESLRAAGVMTPDPVVVVPETMAYAALRLMEDRPSQISVLPVVDGARRCVGMLRLHDVIRSGL